ncbi:ABC transporter substrate-binding protein [Streptomyces acidicola]|uniref:ABC transporter substrate-binding protein n=1 Tax=Streptomyces acidicola TaxID=2596892 RepID=A0A5N8WMK1_9ACTN|nr:ABC transporter substrate-binding protein [Streptomyces acidicola]MPY48663.1 ABC transporter substrate-binding protein [Streptomyces acidicola]
MTLRQLREKTVGLAAVTTVLALTLAGCGGDEGAGDDGSSGGDSSSRQITVAALPLADGAPLYLAQNRGLFKKEGLDVRIQPVQQSIQALPALAKGQVDVIAGANYVTFLQADEKGTLDLRILAEGARVAPHMMDVLVPKDSPIKNADGLKGKKVAVNILNNIQSLTLDAILQERGAGLPEYRQIAFPQMGPALERGQVEAVHAAEPFSSAIQKDLGARVLIDGGSSPVTSIPISGYVTTRSYASGNPEAAAAFQRAVEAAAKIATEDPDAVREQLPEYTRVTAEQAESIHLPAYPATTDADQLRRLTELMREQGLLKKELDPGNLLLK